MQGMKPAKVKGKADVVFCIDVTGSMEPTIEGVKSHVASFVEGLKEQANLSLDWRVKLMAYRDFKVDGNPVEDHPFVDNAADFQNQLNAVTAEGGEDEPESTLDVIYKAIMDSDWREPVTKVIVVITDATTHPEMQQETVGDGMPTDLNQLVNVLTGEGVYLFLIAPDAPEYAELEKVPRSTYKRVDSGSGLAEVDFEELLRVIGKTVSASSAVVKAN